MELESLKIITKFMVSSQTQSYVVIYSNKPQLGENKDFIYYVLNEAEQKWI
jgi:hypothetical protein